MNTLDHTLTKYQKRQRRVRSKVRGTTERPRVSIFRANQHTYVQVIDDVKGLTITSVGTVVTKNTGTKTERAQQLGVELAEKLASLKINKVAFDRGAYRYHGRVKAVAEALRQAGINL